MKKEIIKCDVCKKEIKEGGYYEFRHASMFGWATFYKPHPNGIAYEFQICVDCVKNKLEIKI